MASNPLAIVGGAIIFVIVVIVALIILQGVGKSVPPNSPAYNATVNGEDAILTLAFWENQVDLIAIGLLIFGIVIAIIWWFLSNQGGQQGL